MTKDVPQDIIPPKKSIRNIPIPGTRGGSLTETNYATHQHNTVVRDETVSTEPETLTIRRRKPKVSEPTIESVYPEFTTDRQPEEESVQTAPAPARRVVSFEDEVSNGSTKRTALIVGISVACLLGIFFIFMSFGGATVTVFPKQITSTLKTEVVASKSASTTADQFLFTSTEFTAQATQTVTATGEENVVTKAGGTITIYNEYSEEEQRLVKNTRFATPDGKIFRIQEAVVVPGLTRDAKGNVVPGTRITQVVADEPGKEYNVGSTRFNIPGFEGLPQYSAFYAQSTSSMAGGFNGVKKIISDADRNKAERELRETIKADLLSQANTQYTDESLVLTDESLTTYETLDEVVDGEKVTLGMKGTTKGIQIKTSDLAYALAKQDLNSFVDTDVVEIKNLDTLRMRVFASAADTTLSTVRIAVEGDAIFEWQLDETSFKKALAGKKKDTLASIIQTFSSITKAEGNVRPIWNQTFPTNPEKIKIINVKE
jgi:hypothetical protein